jgi:hypothetical protein
LRFKILSGEREANRLATQGMSCVEETLLPVMEMFGSWEWLFSNTSDNKPPREDMFESCLGDTTKELFFLQN